MKALIPAALSTLLAWPAVAEPGPCGPLAEMEARLAEHFTETRVAQGIGEMNGTHMTMVYASADGATWTALAVAPTGVACVVDTGTDWQTRSDPAPVPETGL